MKEINKIMSLRIRMIMKNARYKDDFIKKLEEKFDLKRIECH